MPAAHGDHGLDGNAHAVFDERPSAWTPVVGHIGILVQLASHAMPGGFAHDAVAATLAVLLHCMAYVASAIAWHCLLDSLVERLLGVAQQLLDIVVDIAHTEGVG